MYQLCVKNKITSAMEVGEVDYSTMEEAMKALETLAAVFGTHLKDELTRNKNNVFVQKLGADACWRFYVENDGYEYSIVAAEY